MINYNIKLIASDVTSPYLRVCGVIGRPLTTYQVLRSPSPVSGVRGAVAVQYCTRFGEWYKTHYAQEDNVPTISGVDHLLNNCGLAAFTQAFTIMPTEKVTPTKSLAPEIVKVMQAKGWLDHDDPATSLKELTDGVIDDVVNGRVSYR